MCDANEVRIFRESCYNALEGRGENEIDTRCEKMECIQEYLDSCYFLSINPLSQLRSILPQYAWGFVRLKSIAQVKKVVAKSDLIWRTNWWDGDDYIDESAPIELVFAVHRVPRDRLNAFFAGKKNASEKTTSKLEFVEACEGDPEYFVLQNC